MELNIKEIKIYLLNKLGEIDSSTGKTDYNKISTATINCTKLKDVKDEYIVGVTSLIYGDLVNNNKHKIYDAIGLEITSNDDTVIENSIDLSVLNDIETYSVDSDVNPFEEFLKMSIGLNKSESES
jgi:hypothetical protein